MKVQDNRLFEYKNSSLEDLDNIVREIKNIDLSIILLYGSLGAGKTEFVRKFLNINVYSPTFSVYNEYHWNNKKILHADFYLQRKIEMIWFYIQEVDLCFIEWAQYVPKDFMIAYKDQIIQVFFKEETVRVIY